MVYIPLKFCATIHIIIVFFNFFTQVCFWLNQYGANHYFIYFTYFTSYAYHYIFFCYKINHYSWIIDQFLQPSWNRFFLKKYWNVILTDGTCCIDLKFDRCANNRIKISAILGSLFNLRQIKFDFVSSRDGKSLLSAQKMTQNLSLGLNETANKKLIDELWRLWLSLGLA